MSASSARKKRLEQANQPEPEKKKQKKKLSQAWIFGITICLIVALLIGGILIYRTVKNNRTVLTVGDHKVTVKEFNYFYNGVANNISSYASYLGIETGKPLDEQYVTSNGAMYLGLFGISTDYLEDKEADEDGVYNVTWAQLFANVAKDNAVSYYAIYNEAKKAGYKPDDHLKQEVEEQIEAMKSYADANGESLGNLIKRVYGSGCTVEGYRNYLTVVEVASHYLTGLRYEDDEIKARYDESPETFTVATYYLYSVNASSFVEADEEGNKADPTDAEKKKAEDDAKAMEKEFDVAKASIMADSVRSSVTSSVSEDAAAWLFDTAKDDDVKTFSNEEGTTYYVIKLIDKSDYQLFNGLRLDITADSEELAEGEESTVDKIKASLEADPSEENFRALIEEYGGEPEDINNITRYYALNLSSDLLNWYLEERKAGDWYASVSGTTTSFLYLTGLGDTYSVASVTNTLHSEWSEELIAAAKEACGYSESAAMTANVGLSFNSN